MKVQRVSFLVVLLAALATGVLVGCSKDDDAEVSNLVHKEIKAACDGKGSGTIMLQENGGEYIFLCACTIRGLLGRVCKANALPYLLPPCDLTEHDGHGCRYIQGICCRATYRWNAHDLRGAGL